MISKTRHAVLVKLKGVFFFHSQEGWQYHSFYWGRECRKWAREDVCRSVYDHELCFILAGEKRAEACGVMSCITASVHNPSHQMSFSEHSLFNTVRSISRWRKGWGDVEPFVQTDTVCEEVQYGLREFIPAEGFNVHNVRLCFAYRTKEQAESGLLWWNM